MRNKHRKQRRNFKRAWRMLRANGRTTHSDIARVNEHYAEIIKQYLYRMAEALQIPLEMIEVR